IGDGGYNFTNIPSPEAEATLWVREAQRRGIRTMAVLAQDYPSINNHVNALVAEANRAGITLTYRQHFPESTSDFRPLIRQAQATRPDTYYVEALTPSLD